MKLDVQADILMNRLKHVIRDISSKKYNTGISPRNRRQKQEVVQAEGHPEHSDVGEVCVMGQEGHL